MKNILEIDGVQLSIWGQKILQNIYLKCESGEIVGVLGRNGCGKSSLFQLAYGEPLTKIKSIRINKKRLPSIYRNPKDMRFLPQHGFIPKNLSVRTVLNDFDLSFEKFIHDFPDYEQLERERIKSLSKGQQRILETYIIILSKTKFCLLDEPFAGISLVRVGDLVNLMEEETAKGKGFIVADHDLQLMSKICKSIYVLKNGALKKLNEQEIFDLKKFI